jgi:hypothetical protein
MRLAGIGGASRAASLSSMWFDAHTVALDVAQAGCIALPASGLPARLDRFRARGWALALPVSIALVVGVIALVPASADVLAWAAIVLVPTGCALALGWAVRAARPWLAAFVVPLFAAAWAFQDQPIGQVSATLLIAGSAVTLGRLLAGATPLALLKVAVVAMAAVDAYLVFSNRLQAPNAVLVAATPPLGLPRLQSAEFGGSFLGYGDFFAAAVVGGILAAERAPQVAAALAMIVVAFCWNQLFAVYDVLPATIPPAVILIAMEVLRRMRGSAWRGSEPLEDSPEGYPQTSPYPWWKLHDEYRGP